MADSADTIKATGGSDQNTESEQSSEVVEETQEVEEQPSESKIEIVKNAIINSARSTKEFIDAHETALLKTTYALGGYGLLNISNDIINNTTFHKGVIDGAVIDGVAVGAMAFLISYGHGFAVGKTTKLLDKVQYREIGAEEIQPNMEEKQPNIEEIVSEAQEESENSNDEERQGLQKIVGFFADVKNNTLKTLNNNRDDILKGVYISGCMVAVPEIYSALQNVNLGDYSLDSLIVGGLTFTAIKAFKPLTDLVSEYMKETLPEKTVQETPVDDTNESLEDNSGEVQKNDDYFSTVKDKTRTAIATAIMIGTTSLALFVPGVGIIKAIERSFTGEAETSPVSMDSYNMVDGLYPSSHGPQVRVTKIAGKEYRTELKLSDKTGRKDYDELYKKDGTTIISDSDGIVWSMSGQNSRIREIENNQTLEYTVRTVTDKGELINYGGLKKVEVKKGELVKPGKIIGYLNEKADETTSKLLIEYTKKDNPDPTQNEFVPIFE